MQGKYLLDINVYLKKNIFTCKNVNISKRLYFTYENIEYNLNTSAFTVVFPQTTSDFQTSIIFL